MKNNIFKFLVGLILISTFSCTDSEVLYQPIDFVFVGEYTQGLEGPAVDEKVIYILSIQLIQGQLEE